MFRFNNPHEAAKLRRRQSVSHSKSDSLVYLCYSSVLLATVVCPQCCRVRGNNCYSVCVLHFDKMHPALTCFFIISEIDSPVQYTVNPEIFV